MATTYRVAIVGCRARGTAAARAYHAHPRTEVVGLCDLLPERLDTLGDELGVPPSARFSDLDEMIRDTTPDIVAIPTGTELHYPLAMRVLEHSVHVEIEKPICATLEQADAVLAKADAQGARVAVHHQTRVGAPMRALARAYEQGKIGALQHVVGTGKGYYGGYDVMNIGTHVINSILKFTGPCRAVTAQATTGGRPVTPDDVAWSAGGMGPIVGEHVTALLDFPNGVSAHLLHYRIFPEFSNVPWGIELRGTEGRLLWRAGKAWLLPGPHFVPDGEHDRWQALEPVRHPAYPAGTRADVEDFWFVDEYVRALDERRDHECSGAEGRHVLEIIGALFESAASGRRVDLPQPRRDHPLLCWRAEHGLGDPPAAPRGYKEWLRAEDVRLGRP
jgi:predicted dehydrogenase